MALLPLSNWTEYELKASLDDSVADFRAGLTCTKQVIGFSFLSEREDHASLTDPEPHFKCPSKPGKARKQTFHASNCRF